MVADDDEARTETWKLINAEIAARLSRLETSMTRVETKAALIVGFAATAAQFLASKNPFVTTGSTIFGLVSFAAYTAAFGIGVWIVRVSKFHDLSVKTLRTLSGSDHFDVIRQLVDTRVHLFDVNSESHRRKVSAWKWSLWFLAAGLLASGACIVQTA